MTVKIWGRPNGLNVQKVMWCVGEIGLQVQRVDWGGPYGGNDDPSYRVLNPNGRVPTLDDNGFVLWESNAIIRYLAEKHRAEIWPRALPARATAGQWMDWQQTTLRRPVMDIFYCLIRTPAAERDEDRLAVAVAQSATLYQILERHLAQRAFLAGDEFSIADIPAGVLTYRWFSLPIERPKLPRVEAWYKRLTSRPAYRRHVMMPLT